jgi:hypothetical protein
MMSVGRFPTATCRGADRRPFLKTGRLGATRAGALRATKAEGAAPVKAKSVLFVFLWGAPSHLDTRDPKPDARVEDRGPFGVIPRAPPAFTSQNCSPASPAGATAARLSARTSHPLRVTPTQARSSIW